MKTYLLLIVILINAQISYSQTSNYKIIYRHCLQIDTSQKLRDTVGLQATLIGNSKESNYSFAKLPKDYKSNIKNTTFGDIIKNKTQGTQTIKGSNITYDSIGNILYQNKLTKKIFVREKMANEYLITEEITPAINWEITEDKKIIKNYTCQKAVTYFRGRYYIAWFTTQIPIVAAPWKFNGLPGLLMDIEDINHQVKIYIESIEYPSTEKVGKFIDKGNKVSLQKYFTRREEENKKMLQNMLIMMQNQEDGNGKRIENVKFSATSKSALYNIEIKMD